MMLLIRRPGPGWIMGASTNEGDSPMKWETPHAIDYRFGMEITMYISTR
jgi:coenzyme PQQ precursor peptide PqqA